MAMSDLQCHPQMFCLIKFKYEKDINVYNFKT